jgi:hypothetical protein
MEGRHIDTLRHDVCIVFRVMVLYLIRSKFVMQPSFPIHIAACSSFPHTLAEFIARLGSTYKVLKDIVCYFSNFIWALYT